MLAALMWMDWLVVAAYLAGIFLVGLVFTRRAGKSTGEFFVAGRNLPWWLAGTSMVATAFSSDTPLVVTGWVRSGGVSGNWLWWSFAVGGMFSVFLLSRLWRRAEVVTMVELTEMRYSGRSAAALRLIRAGYFALPLSCIPMAWTLVGMIKVTGVLLEINPLPAVLVCIAVTTLYTAFAGSWGVVVTDFIQFIVAMGGAIVLCVLALGQVGGLSGLAGSGELAGRLDFFPRLPTGAEMQSFEFWKGGFATFVIYLSIQWWANKNADGGAVVVQRMSSTKDERQSLLATLWFNIANYAIKPWPWILVALASLVLLPHAKDEDAYPEMIKRLVPPGLVGLMVASFMAAFMSMINTFLNLSSSFFVTDFYKRFLVRQADDKHYVMVGRLASVMFMAISAGVAMVSESISGLFTFLLSLTAGFGSVYILKWFWWRINAWSEISAMIASTLIAGGLYLARSFRADLLAAGLPIPQMTEAMILSVTALLSTAVWVVVTLSTKPVDQAKLLAFYRKVRPYGFWGPVARASGVTPPNDLGRLLISWLAGVVMVLGATIALGKFLLGFALEGSIYLAAALAGGITVWLLVFRRSSPPPESVPVSFPAAETQRRREEAKQTR